MDIDTLRIIDTGLDPVTAEREQWDDGNNTLAIAPAAVRGVRAQRRDQRPAGAGRHRGDPDPRLRAGLRPGRPALHVLPLLRDAASRLRAVTGSLRSRAREAAQRSVSWRPSRPWRARRSAASAASVTASASAYRLANSASGASHSSAAGSPREVPDRHQQAVRPEHAGELGAVAEQQLAARRPAGPARPAPRPRRRAAPSARGPCRGTRHQYAAGAAASRTVG